MSSFFKFSKSLWESAKMRVLFSAENAKHHFSHRDQSSAARDPLNIPIIAYTTSSKQQHSHQIGQIAKWSAFVHQSTESSTIAPARRHVVDAHIDISFDHLSTPELKCCRSPFLSHRYYTVTLDLLTKFEVACSWQKRTYIIVFSNNSFTGNFYFIRVSWMNPPGTYWGILYSLSLFNVSFHMFISVLFFFVNNDLLTLFCRFSNGRKFFRWSRESWLTNWKFIVKQFSQRINNNKWWNVFLIWNHNNFVTAARIKCLLVGG